MCGICGFSAATTMTPEARERVRRMQAALHHRGPDSDGFYEHSSVLMAARRLRIVDCAGSDQPLTNETGSVVLVYNGMIYNFRELRDALRARGHRFKTQGDGEVIVHLYEEHGTVCFAMLQGMFAVALYDVQRARLVLARDQGGIKPLYYAPAVAGISFSSEARALIATGMASGAIDSQGLDLYLAFNYVPGVRTIYAGISRVLPGECLTVERAVVVGKERFGRSSRPVTAASAATNGECIQQIDRLLRASIESHLCADKAVGCFLSGGLDSSTIVHYMATSGVSRIKTFSVGYDDRRCDERPYARLVAARYGTDHHEVECTYGDVASFLEQLPAIGDVPVGDQAIVSTWLVSQAAKQSVDVCLSGDGGDELFLGYPTYQINHWYARLAALPPWLLRAGERCAAAIPSRGHNVDARFVAQQLLTGLRLHDLRAAHASWRCIFSLGERRRIRADGYLPVPAHSREEYFSMTPPGRDAQSACADADLAVWLPDNNLLRTDMYSMRHSLEVRVPLLSQPLVDYVTGLPYADRFKPGHPKYLLRQVVSQYLPKAIVDRRKTGWHMPIAEWLRGPLYGYCHDQFHSSHRLFDLIDRDMCCALLDEHRRRRANNTFKLWGLLVLLRHTG